MIHRERIVLAFLSLRVTFQLRCAYSPPLSLSLSLSLLYILVTFIVILGYTGSCSHRIPWLYGTFRHHVSIRYVTHKREHSFFLWSFLELAFSSNQRLCVFLYVHALFFKIQDSVKVVMQHFGVL